MNFGNNLQRTSPIVLNLIIINSLVYLAGMLLSSRFPPGTIEDLFALHHYKSDVFRPYQLVTHMFLHGGFTHLLFNMLALWMFGVVLERVWGPKRFLTFYLICGVGAGLAQMGNYMYDYWDIDHTKLIIDQFTEAQYQLSMRNNATVGASGAIMGVVAAFGYLFPNTQLFIIPIPFPVKAKWAIPGIIALDVFGGISRAANDNIAHFAHVGGALIGFLIVLYWNRTQKQTFY